MDTVNGVMSSEYDCNAESIEVTPTIFSEYDNPDLTPSESNSEMAHHGTSCFLMMPRQIVYSQLVK